MTPRAEPGRVVETRAAGAGQVWSLRRRAALAAILVLTPVAILVSLLFGAPGDINMCLSQFCANNPPPTPPPTIGRSEILAMIVSAMVVAWVGAGWFAVRYLWSHDRGRLRLAAGVAILVSVGTIAIIGVLRWSEGRRLRTVAEDAFVFGFGVLVVAATVVLAWAILTTRRTSQS